ncbi:MAG: hypothetical protein ACKN9D_13820 [Actinomycetales bacterium]
MPGSVGVWRVPTPDAHVRLRSNRIGLMDLEASAPVRSGLLTVSADAARIELVLALEQLRASFLLERAARALVSAHQVHDLAYDATGPGGKAPWSVRGDAIAGNVVVDLTVEVTPRGPAHDEMAQVELRGFAALGAVELPLPGLGRIDDLRVTLDSVLALQRYH